MFTNLSHVFLWVRDQQEAKDFYLDRLGFEPGVDITLEQYGGMRWLTVVAPGGTHVVLSPIDGSVVHDPDGPAFLAEMLAKGLGAAGILHVDDGVDAAFRDLSGNQWQVTQPAPVPAEV